MLLNVHPVGHFLCNFMAGTGEADVEEDGDEGDDGELDWAIFSSCPMATADWSIAVSNQFLVSSSLFRLNKKHQIHPESFDGNTGGDGADALCKSLC